MMGRIRHFFKLYPLPFLSGIFVGTSFIPFPPWALIFCYVPLWFFALKKAQNLKQIFWAGWCSQFILTLIGFHWIAFTAHEFGFFPWPLAILTLLVFASLMHLYIPLSLVFGMWVSRRLELTEGPSALVFAAVLTLGEIFWPSIFTWNLGYPLLWIHSPLAQWADVIGFQGLSFLVYLANAWILWLILRKDWTWTFISIALGACLAGVFYFGGLQKIENWKKTDSELKVLLVQANIGNQEKYLAEKGAGFQQFIVDEFFELTRKGLATHPNSDLIIWPESAFPDFLNNFAASRKYPAQFREFSKSINKPILTGAFSRDGVELKVRRDYNGLFLFDNQGSLLGEPYHKTELLIFGETIPLVETFPILAKYNPGGAGFGRGQGPMILTLGAGADQVKLGGEICYESLDPQFSAKLSQLGADVLVNVTNDSWFSWGPNFEPSQNGFMSLARAVEVRRPMIRSTNTGISTGILADGTVLEQSPVGVKWFGQLSVKFQKMAPLTFYAQFGSWLWSVIFVFLIGVIALGKKQALRGKKRVQKS